RDRSERAPEKATETAVTDAAGTEEQGQRREGEPRKRRRGGRNRNRDRNREGTPETADGLTSELSADADDNNLANDVAVDSGDNAAPRAGRRPADKRARPPRQRQRGPREEVERELAAAAGLAAAPAQSSLPLEQDLA